MIPARSKDAPLRTAVRDSIEYWFEQHKLVTNFKWIQAFGQTVSWLTFASFAEMVWANTFAVGCGVVKSQSNYYITCTYNTGRVLGEPVYEEGAMGSKCRKGMNQKYPPLCNEKEFQTSISESPVVNQWIYNRKKIV